MIESIEEELKDFKEHLLDKEYPPAIDEILCEIEYIYEGDDDISEVMDELIKGYNEMWLCAEKYLKIKDIVLELDKMIKEPTEEEEK